MLRLVTTPRTLDRFDAHLGDTLIVTSRQPLLDGARVLLERGYDPDTLVTVRHHDRDHDSFKPKPIGELAKWTVTERDVRGLRLERWRPYDAAATYAVHPRISKSAPEGVGGAETVNALW